MNSPTNDAEKLPIDPRRVRAFANFFKRYMNISSLVTAALPVPITAFKLIPTYDAQTKVLSVYTSLFCFLILAFIFFSRHKLARMMFAENYGYMPPKFRINVLPALLILSSLAFLLGYHFFLDASLPKDLGERAYVLKNYAPPALTSLFLYGLYLGIFITAEAAFILMAIKEYLQDILGLSDLQVIEGRTVGKTVGKKDPGWPLTSDKE